MKIHKDVNKKGTGFFEIVCPTFFLQLQWTLQDMFGKKKTSWYF